MAPDLRAQPQTIGKRNQLAPVFCAYDSWHRDGLGSVTQSQWQQPSGLMSSTAAHVTQPGQGYHSLGLVTSDDIVASSWSRVLFSGRVNHDQRLARLRLFSSLTPIEMHS